MTVELKDPATPEEKVERLDPELEAMIDKAGRDAVFARARQYGWSANLPPPAYVWRGIATEIQTGRFLRAKGEQ